MQIPQTMDFRMALLNDTNALPIASTVGYPPFGSSGDAASDARLTQKPGIDGFRPSEANGKPPVSLP
jgi:hypothetical protein